MAFLKEAMHLGVLFYPSQKFSSVFSKVFLPTYVSDNITEALSGISVGALFFQIKSPSL